MLTIPVRLVLVVGIGLAGAACQNDNYGAPSGAYQPAYNNGYYAPPPQPRYGYAQPAPNYGYNQGRTTTVTVTNRGQNGYRDDVVQQQVQCGSQYYDGYRYRIARC
jgi:hypothetical protein